jgi:hypothetical protein
MKMAKTEEGYVLKEDLGVYAYEVIRKKFDRLERRRFVLFPWLRIRRLLKLYKYAKEALK